MSKMWPDTPIEERVRARLLDGAVVDFKQLRCGDIFQAIDPDGDVVDPITWDPAPEIFALCDGDPEPRPHGDSGYMVPVYTGKLDELRTRTN